MIPNSIRALAARQHGVVNRKQLGRAGISRRVLERLVANRELEPLHRGVYALPGPGTERREIIAAVLAAGWPCVASHLAAARVHRLGELPFRIEVTVQHRRRPEVHGAILHRVTHLPPEHVCLASGIPVTTPARTIIDLAGSGDEVSRFELAATLDHGIKRGRVSCEQIRKTLEPLRCFKGRATILALLDQRPDGRPRVESPMEAEVQELLAKEDIEFSPQYDVFADGRFVGRIDIAFPGARLGLEYDSYLWHSARTDWERDHKRTSDLVVSGWRILPVTLEDVREGRDAFLAKLRRALAWRDPEALTTRAPSSPARRSCP
jgi:hypothetical protein